MYNRNRFSNDEQIKYLKERYPKGTRVQLISMEDGNAVKPGTLGTVCYVDSMGTIEVDWDDGRSLSLIPKADSFRVVFTPEKEKEKTGDAR